MGARVKRIVAVVAQGAGVLLMLGAIAELAGPAWSALTAGAGLVAYGVLSEAGWI